MQRFHQPPLSAETSGLESAAAEAVGIQDRDIPASRILGFTRHLLRIGPATLFQRLVLQPGPVTERRRFVLPRSEEHTSELQSLMRISYAVFCLKKKKK